MKDTITCHVPCCVVCGNQYDKLFQVIHHEEKYYFDCFECAIHLLAPSCGRCGCKIIGHGVEASGYFYCCAHCAKEAGFIAAKDRI